jgi:hypothetical protein
MLLYGDINLHANNSVIVLLNDRDQVIYQWRHRRPCEPGLSAGRAQ